MALFATVNRLAGSAVVHGVMRQCEFHEGRLTIEGLTLPEAMTVLGALSSDTLAVARLKGVLPEVPAVATLGGDVHVHNHAPAPPKAPPPAPVAQAPAPAPSAPPVAPPSAPAAPPVVVAPVASTVVTGPEVDREVARIDAGAAASPEADPFTAPEPSVVAPEAPAAEVYPTDVTRAQTLRPVVGWFGETKGIRDLAAMIEAVRALAPHCPLVKKIIDTENDKLNARVEKTMTTLGYL